MTTLLLRLAGPLQAWGASSRFSRRDTRHEPTKSGVIGLLAAAQGLRRTDPLEALAALAFGVRVDQPGSLVRDFQVARSLDGTKTFPLSYRYYLSDAVFLAAVEGEEGLIRGLADALRAPAYPLFLGRRACPPVFPLMLTISESSLIDALRTHPWQASEWHRRRQASTVRLRIAMDASDGVGELVRDVPVDFDPEYRRYEWRAVAETYVDIDNPGGRDQHDAFAALGGG